MHIMQLVCICAGWDAAHGVLTAEAFAVTCSRLCDTAAYLACVSSVLAKTHTSAYPWQPPWRVFCVTFAAHLAARLACLRLHGQSPAVNSTSLQEAELPAAAFKTYLVSVYEAPPETADTVGPLPDQPDQVTPGMASSLYDPDDVSFMPAAAHLLLLICSGIAHGSCICCCRACSGVPWVPCEMVGFVNSGAV